MNIRSVLRATASIAVVLFISSCKQMEKTATEVPTLNKRHEAAPKMKLLKMFLQPKKDTAESLSREEHFDQHGYRTSAAYYLEGGAKEYETTLTNDDEGRILKSHTVYTDGTWADEVNSYKDKNLVKTEWKRSDGDFGYNEYKYDAYSNMIQWDTYDKGHYEMTRLYKIVYDDKGRQQKNIYMETRNGHDTSAVSSIEFTYNEQGRPAQKLFSNGNFPQSLEQYLYDSLGNRIVESTFAPDTASPDRFVPVLRKIYTFNAYGEPLTVYTYKYNELESKASNTWDSFGNLIESVTEGPENTWKRERYEYEFWK